MGSNDVNSKAWKWGLGLAYIFAVATIWIAASFVVQSVVDAGLLDNVLSDYMWAKAVLLTSTTVATAGLTIQVPLAAIVDTLTGNAPRFMDYLGAVAVMIGFTGINIPSDTFSKSKETTVVLENENLNIRTEELTLARSQDSASIS